MRLLIGGLLVIALVGCTSTPAEVEPQPTVTVTVTATASPAPSPTRGAETVTHTGVVTNVVDGDTIDVEGAGRVRLRGVDTPERGECGFGPATEFVEDLTLGQVVTLIRPEGSDDTDRYDRLLRYVEVNGVDVGLATIEAGLANARYDSRDGFGWHPRQEAYIAADATTQHVCSGR